MFYGMAMLYNSLREFGVLHKNVVNSKVSLLYTKPPYFKEGCMVSGLLLKSYIRTSLK